VEVQINTTPPPNVAGIHTCFSCNSWSMQAVGELRQMLRSVPPGAPAGWRAARFSLDCTSAAVYYGSAPDAAVAGAAPLPPPLIYPLDQILLMYVLARHDGLLVHAAGAVANGRGLVFPGRSGAGKSTISRCLAADARVGVLSDDRIVIRKSTAGYILYGTPWPGDAGIAENAGAPLRGLLFLHKDSCDRLRPISSTAAVERLLQVTSVPWYDRDVMDRVVSACEALALAVPACELSFRKDGRVNDLVLEFAAGTA
jgi:hypothetical protein